MQTQDELQLWFLETLLHHRPKENVTRHHYEDFMGHKRGARDTTTREPVWRSEEQFAYVAILTPAPSSAIPELPRHMIWYLLLPLALHFWQWNPAWPIRTTSYRSHCPHCKTHLECRLREHMGHTIFGHFYSNKHWAIIILKSANNSKNEMLVAEM